MNQPPGRTGILVHGPERHLGGSSGCIAIQDHDNDFSDWQDWMQRIRECNGNPNAPNPVPMTIAYAEDLEPVHQWK